MLLVVFLQASSTQGNVLCNNSLIQAVLWLWQLAAFFICTGRWALAVQGLVLQNPAQPEIQNLWAQNAAKVARQQPNGPSLVAGP